MPESFARLCWKQLPINRWHSRFLHSGEIIKKWVIALNLLGVANALRVFDGKDYFSSGFGDRTTEG